MDWFKLPHHPSPQSLVTATTASVFTAAAIFIYQYYDRRSRISELKQQLSGSFSDLDLNATASGVLGSAGVTQVNGAVRIGDVRHGYSEELVREQLARNYAFLGEEGVDKVRKSFVIVIGLGGVGSHAAHMLLRSGVEHLRLVDFDQVTLSSLNRHAVARQADVGTPKVTCIERHFKEIAPHARIDARAEMFSAANADDMLSGDPDYVLDCIDNMDTKLELIQICVERGLRIVSSMGSGAKSDPSRIQIADISDTQEDPLARATRRGLRRVGIEKGVTVVYSTEKPGKVGLLPLDEEKADAADQYATLPNFRARILPVLGTIPAIFGCALASYVLTELAGFETRPLAIKLRDGTYNRLHRDLCNKEKDYYLYSGEIPFTVSDVGYIFEE
ncbi:hypothetical protein HK102_004925, partial [Quaeritorhiza haematococci]